MFLDQDLYIYRSILNSSEWDFKRVLQNAMWSKARHGSKTQIIGSDHLSPKPIRDWIRSWIVRSKTNPMSKNSKKKTLKMLIYSYNDLYKKFERKNTNLGMLCLSYMNKHYYEHV